MITENGEGMGGNGAGCHVKYAGELFTCNAVQIGYHQQKALGCGEGGSQSPRHKRAMDSSCGACLGLHLCNLNGMTKNIFSSLGRPFVGTFCHGGRGGNGIDGGYLAVGVGNVGRSLIAVHGFVFSFHVYLLE